MPMAKQTRIFKSRKEQGVRHVLSLQGQEQMEKPKPLSFASTQHVAPNLLFHPVFDEAEACLMRRLGAVHT
jgi:hypothetical protein